MLDARKGAVSRLVFLLGLAYPPAAIAQDNTVIPAPPISARQFELGKKQSELDQLALEAKVSADRVAELEAEIEALKKDELAITAALIQSAKTQKKLASDIAGIESRLKAQRDIEAGVRASLNGRKGVLAEVLGALQRMGLNPPPAILVKPEDALSSVRSAILLGAVVPELRRETEKLVADLDALKRITTSINAEREGLLAALKAQEEEKLRLDGLIGEKRRLRGENELARKTENERVASLVAKSESLKDLISALKKDMEAEKQTAERARREEERRIAVERDKARKGEQSALLAPGADLKKLKGALVLPVSGKIARPFGSDDGFGGRTSGLSVLADAGSIVTTPVDATVLYAGPFRSYHQLLILDAGSGYHLVMGGMDRSVVNTGQFLLAGEPVGMMASGNSDTATSLTKLPELYIELRQDGQPVDSAPWWAGEPKGRTGNAT